MKNIERGEARISQKDEIMKAIGKKLDRYKNPWLELKIQYWQNKGKLYNEECDRFMICMVHKLGYGSWDELKAAFRTSPLFRFDWFIKSRTTRELARGDVILLFGWWRGKTKNTMNKRGRLVKRRISQEYPVKACDCQKDYGSPPASQKKRKQLSMDGYVSSGKKRK